MSINSSHFPPLLSSFFADNGIGPHQPPRRLQYPEVSHDLSFDVVDSRHYSWVALHTTFQGQWIQTRAHFFRNGEWTATTLESEENNAPQRTDTRHNDQKLATYQTGQKIFEVKTHLSHWLDSFPPNLIEE